jgi:beta-1,4-mannosyltransferase
MGSDDMIVASAPTYRNPYQHLLAQALRGQGVDTVACINSRLASRFPLTRWIGSMEPRPTIVHLHWADYFFGADKPVQRMLQCLSFVLDVLLLARRCGVVWTIHNIEGHDRRALWMDRIVGRVLGRLASSVIVHSRAEESLARHTLRIAREKLLVVPQGPYRQLYEPLEERVHARQAIGLPLQARVFLFFGLIRPYKGVVELLRAWRRRAAQETLEPAILVIAGDVADQEYADELRELAAGMEATVRLELRRIEDSDVGLYFGAADVAVFPFRKITNSSSVSLAMEFGLPIVAPDFPVLREMLRGATDFLYEPGETGLEEALSRAMVGDLDEPRERIQSASERFDWSVAATATIDGYRKIAPRGP